MPIFPLDIEILKDTDYAPSFQHLAQSLTLSTQHSHWPVTGDMLHHRRKVNTLKISTKIVMLPTVSRLILKCPKVKNSLFWIPVPLKCKVCHRILIFL